MSDGIKDLDIKGRHVVLKAEVLKPEYRDIRYRVILAKDGFGCYPFTSGSAVFATHVCDGESARWERYQIERLATDEEVAAARVCP